MTKTAVVLFNLGGPDGPDAVLPFLINLFSDPAILRMGQPFRWLLAQTIARRRAPLARGIYAQIGGGSPILAQTQAQAAALEAELADLGDVKIFIAMRYWHPRAALAAEKVRAFGPDKVVLLPLYPQYSTTTTASSVSEWEKVSFGMTAPVAVIGCYPSEPWFTLAHVQAITPLVEEARKIGPPRILFSAHGLPKRISDDGDPYAGQTERTAQAIAEQLGLSAEDWRVCYQSRVGRLEWIGPSTDDEIQRAGRDGVPVVVVPIAFVSEHSETLVELDIEYRHLAEKSGVPGYFRAPTPGDEPTFIQGLATLVRGAVSGEFSACPSNPARLCPRAQCGPTKEAA